MLKGVEPDNLTNTHKYRKLPLQFKRRKNYVQRYLASFLIV